MKRKYKNSDWRFLSRGMILLFALLFFGLTLSYYGVSDMTNSSAKSFLTARQFIQKSTLQNLNLGLLLRRIDELLGIEIRR